ncbi:MAG: 3-dehydroquinate synthase [Bacilli bacterium]|nr:3-dehydroquinate synthase [Bacilli bacterium]
MEIISIHSKKKDYKVIIDKSINDLIEKELNKETNYFIVLDSKLVEEYYEFLTKTLPNSNIYIVEGGEEAKSLETYEKVISEMLSVKVSKKDTIVAFGGGTIGDLVGYIAATYKRGINFINVATTTLAAVDASIGGKNALNVGDVKNAIGTINPPDKVLIGLDTLSLLDKKDFNNGLYEALKTGIILDKEIFDLFKNEKERTELEQIIVKSINAKKQVVEKDEDNTGYRNILNYGHTIGHALESFTMFDLKHGEAVANGMLFMAKDTPFEKDLKAILERMKCPIINKCQNIHELLEFIQNDKKADGDFVDLIIATDIEKVVTKKTHLNELKGMIEDYGL